MKKSFVPIILLLFFLTLAHLATAIPVSATVKEYSDRTAFNAAATGLTNIDFEGLGVPNGYYIRYASGLSLSGATFSDADTHLYAISPAYYSHIYNYGTGVVLSAQGRAGYSEISTLDVILPANTTAVGTDIGSSIDPNWMTPSPSFTITLSTGDVFHLDGGSPITGFNFIGFASDTAISSISFSNMRIPIYDNFTFGQANDISGVPEPSTFLLVVAGLAGAAAFGRRVRK